MKITQYTLTSPLKQQREYVVAITVILHDIIAAICGAIDALGYTRRVALLVTIVAFSG